MTKLHVKELRVPCTVYFNIYLPYPSYTYIFLYSSSFRLTLSQYASLWTEKREKDKLEEEEDTLHICG